MNSLDFFMEMTYNVVLMKVGLRSVLMGVARIIKIWKVGKDWGVYGFKN